MICTNWRKGSREKEDKFAPKSIKTAHSGVDLGDGRRCRCLRRPPPPPLPLCGLVGALRVHGPVETPVG